MKSKNLFSILIFGLFLFLLPSFAKAAPDLIITDIRPSSYIDYTIKNQGASTAYGGHSTYLYVDGVLKNQDQISSSLSAGASLDRPFNNNYWWSCSGSSDTIKVCADGGSVTSESNETNNCLEVTWPCQSDLIITNVAVYGSGMAGAIYYTIKNQGAQSADNLMYSYLYVNGTYVDSKQDSIPLAAGAIGYGTFLYKWTCTGTSNTIKVCADGSNAIPESNESNNCLQQTFTCPDLVITSVSYDGTNVNYTIKNQGQVSTYPINPISYLYFDGSYKTQKAASGDGGASYSYSLGLTCSDCPKSHSIEVCADKAGPNGAAASGGGDVVETNENNNCNKITVTCGQACCGNLSLTVSGNAPSCTVTPNLCSTCCDGKSWQIIDNNGVTKCSGTIVGDAFCPPGTCTSWTVGAGTYTYTLYIGGVSMSSDSVDCSGASNVPPTCNSLSASPTSGTTPLVVNFTASGSDSDGTINQYEFDFGDGSPLVYSTAASVTHTYNATGTYCAKLRVEDNNGAWNTNTGSCPGGTCTTQITVTAPVTAISRPSVVTYQATNVTQTSATLNGELLSLGYDPGTCPNCKSIVWFEWGTSGTPGVSGSYGSSTTPITVTAPSPFMAAVVSLTPGQTYYFEAFAKNGGSW